MKPRSSLLSRGASLTSAPVGVTSRCKTSDVERLWGAGDGDGGESEDSGGDGGDGGGGGESEDVGGVSGSSRS